MFKPVDSNPFKFIYACELAKVAWEMLLMPYEVTNTARLSRLQFWTTKFENLKMHEEDTIGEFNVMLCNIANKSFTLGEKMSEEKLVRKT